MAHDIHQQENQLVSREAQTLGSYDFHHCWRAVSRPLDTRTLVYITGAFMALVMANGAGLASGTAHLLFIFWFLFKQILTCVSGVYGGFFFQTGLKVAPLQAVCHCVCDMLCHSSRTFGLVLSDLNGAIKTFCRPKARFALPLLDRLDRALQILPHRSHADHGSHSLEP